MSKTQIYLGIDLLDFTGVVNVKRQVSDIRDPEIGSSVKSYTLSIPLTPSNKRLLKFIHDVRSREEVSDQARIVVGGVEVIRGKFRILVSNSLYVRAIVEADDWVDDISGTSIKDLSWASGDEHSFTSANIVSSWSASAGALYRYPLINFSELISGDYGTGGSAIYPYEFYPMWSIEDIVTKLLLDSGYTLEPNGFFSGTFGRSLYLLSKATPADDDFISGKAMDVYVDDNTDNQDSQSIGTGNTDGVSLAQVVDIDAETTDEGSDFATSTNRYTAPADGTYRFQGQVTVYCSFNRSPGNWSVVSNSITLSIRKNGVAIESVSASGVTAFDSGNALYDVDTGYVYLEAGDYIEMYVNMSAIGTNDSPGTLTAYLYLMNGATVSFLKNVWSEQNLWPGIGQTISPADFLPDIDGIDLLKGLKDMCNLRFWVDRMNKTIYIETSDDFYGSTVLDWSDRIDYSEEVNIDVISSNYKRLQRFKYIPDTSDKAYTNHVSANGVPFQKELIIDSNYVQMGVKERPNSVFSPTVTGSMPQIGHWGPQLVPRIFGSGEFVSGSRAYPATRAKSWNPRILEWKGLVALSEGNFDYYEDFEDTSATNYTTFPQAATPDMNDMYDDYMLKDWNRIEKNKIISCVVKLTPMELMQFATVVGTAEEEGFRATILTNVEGVDMYYILNNYVTDGDRVKCELVQKL